MSRHLKRNRKIPVDVMGIVLQVGEVGTIQRKSDGSSVYKRDIQICDMSNHKVLGCSKGIECAFFSFLVLMSLLPLSEGFQIVLTLWGNHAETLTIQVGDIISAQKISVGDYQGCSLNTIPRSNVEMNPSVEEAKALRTWWDEHGSKTEFVHIGSVTVLQSIISLGLRI